MVMHHVPRFIVGVIGNVISGFLFLSPLPTFWRMGKNKSTEEFEPYPYLAALMNCMMWVLYGLIHPNSLLVLTINGIGAVIEICYIIFFYIYANPNYKHNKLRVHILIIVAAEVVFVAIIAVGNMFLAHTSNVRSKDIGILCIIFGFLMYVSPLSNVQKVYKTKSSEFMPFWLCLVGFVNGLLWFSYGLLTPFDINLVVGNGLGAVCGAVQLIFYFLYRNGKSKIIAELDTKPNNVQLADVV